MRDTTVQITKLTEVAGKFYRGGVQVVTSDVAAQLVESGNAKILGQPKPKAKAAKTETGQSAAGEK